VTAKQERLLGALDLLSDFVAHPLLDPQELRRERGVVIQEILATEEDFDELACHLMMQAMYGRHPLGRPVLGSVASINRVTAADVARFAARQWSPASGAAVLVGAVGQLDETRICEFLERLAAVPAAPAPPAAPEFRRNVRVARQDSEQSHLSLSFEPLCPITNARERAALDLYGVVLGGSMGSRLFDELREQRGICYSVGSWTEDYPDAVYVGVATAVAVRRCVEAYERTCEIVEELSEDGPTREEVERAREYRLGAITIAHQSVDALAEACVEQVLCYGEELNPMTRRDAITNVSYEEVVEVARCIDPCPAVGCVGDHMAEDFDN
jgi:predicted Zn-dependent peptidase